jgi:hypothetical protein
MLTETVKKVTVVTVEEAKVEPEKPTIRKAPEIFV